MLCMYWYVRAESDATLVWLTRLTWEILSPNASSRNMGLIAKSSWSNPSLPEINKQAWSLNMLCNGRLFSILDQSLGCSWAAWTLPSIHAFCICPWLVTRFAQKPRAIFIGVMTSLLHEHGVRRGDCRILGAINVSQSLNRRFEYPKIANITFIREGGRNFSIG